MSRNELGIRLWRLVNTGILLYGFFSPWQTFSSDIGPPFVTFETTGFEWITVWFWEPQLIISSPVVFLALLCVPIATIINTYKSFFPCLKCRRLLLLSLGGSLIGSTIFYSWNEERLAWGFWVTCIGLLSSVLFETLGWAFERHQNQALEDTQP
jgi:hypothetical protein